MSAVHTYKPGDAVLFIGLGDEKPIPCYIVEQTEDGDYKILGYTPNGSINYMDWVSAEDLHPDPSRQPEVPVRLWKDYHGNYAVGDKVMMHDDG